VCRGGGDDADERSHAAQLRECRVQPTAPALSGHLYLELHHDHDTFKSLTLYHNTKYLPISSPLPHTSTLQDVSNTKDSRPLPLRYIALHTLSQAAYTNQPADLKNTTDDALPNYLHSLKFRQLYTQTDIRLALGYLAVAISGALFYFDWKYSWEASKPYTLPAVLAYFALNGAFSYWLWWVERGVVYEGVGKTGRVRSLYIHILHCGGAAVAVSGWASANNNYRSAYPPTPKNISPSTNATSPSRPLTPLSHKQYTSARP
jgi:hypothetical protein